MQAATAKESLQRKGIVETFIDFLKCSQDQQLKMGNSWIHSKKLDEDSNNIIYKIMRGNYANSLPNEKEKKDQWTKRILLRKKKIINANLWQLIPLIKKPAFHFSQFHERVQCNGTHSRFRFQGEIQVTRNPRRPLVNEDRKKLL